MKKALRDAYNRELALLYERSAEFAAEYPGIADRLGGLLRDNIDPAVAGLMEGTAFLAARVQLKMEEEFRTFTEEFLEQIFPDALRPIPSAMLVQAQPPWDNSELANGLHFAPGDYLDARFVDADERVSCRFRLGSPLSLWPLEIADVAYHATAAPLSALGQDAAPGAQAGLRIDLRRPDGEALAALPLDDLPIYLTAPMDEAAALYEQIHCDLQRISLRWLDTNGDPVFRRLNPASLEQVGFRPEDQLLDRNTRLFGGFAQLLEGFVFPRKYLGFRLTGLAEQLRGVQGSDMQIVLEFGKANPMLATRLEPSHLRLHTATAINLFEETASQVRLDGKRHEYVVTPDSSPLTRYEIHHVTEVFAHYTGGQAKVRVHPLYGVPDTAVPPRQALYYTTRRKPRRLTDHERRFGQTHRYRGTETFISIYEPPELEEAKRAQRLQIKTLCSNRHLPEYLPIADAQNDFHMSNDTTVSLTCVAGPTPPREPMTELDRAAPHRAQQGDVYWRLISYLSLSHFGIDDRDGKGAGSLREILSLFADLSDLATETQLQGIKALTTRPVTRSIQRGDGFFPARGIEITVRFDEDAFEGSGVILLGAMLDRFFAEYAAINSFTQTVIASQQRGVIATFPPRTGSGVLL